MNFSPPIYPHLSINTRYMVKRTEQRGYTIGYGFDRLWARYECPAWCTRIIDDTVPPSDTTETVQGVYTPDKMTPAPQFISLINQSVKRSNTNFASTPGGPGAGWEQRSSLFPFTFLIPSTGKCGRTRSQLAVTLTPQSTVTRSVA